MSARAQSASHEQTTHAAGAPRDAALMARALFHAARGAGRTTPNPMVGAVVVDAHGIVVGHGWHERAGRPHAEINALAQAGSGARGGTLYVSLEPCHHVGRTGPCTRRIIEAGITRVVAAMIDPDPRVSGRGVAALRAAGIEVETGLGESEARRLNQAFISVKTRQRPLVVVKAATSVDGRIARPGERIWLSSPGADRRSQQLRATVDAVLVGSETVLVDDPLLSVRDTARLRPLVRVVLDRRLRTPPTAKLLSRLDDGPVIILTSSTTLGASGERVAALERAGVTVGAADTLHAAVTSLLAWDVSTVLVEGGPQVHAAFWEAGLVDRVHLIVTPRVLGLAALPLFAGYRVPWSALSLTRVEPRGDDIWIEADVHRDR